MEGIIRVEPQVLITTAQEFSGEGDQIRALTTEMVDLATGLSSVWEGEAATAYITKFQGLQDDITRMLNMVREHSTDLQEMAQLYIQAENANAEAAQTLSSDVIV